MAKLPKGGFEFTGSIGNLSAYKRIDMDRTIIRTKGGPSKEKIRRQPSFDVTRRNNSEFGGRSRFAGWILMGLDPLRPLSDYNMASAFNALLTPVQLMDTGSELGQRSIELSKAPAALQGFPFNRRNVFEAVVRSSLSFTVSKEERRAELELPELITGRNFFPVDTYPVFRWQAALCAVPDLFCKGGGKYHPAGKFEPYNAGHYAGDWQPCGAGAQGTSIELGLPYAVEGEAFSLLLAVGIAFGVVRAGGGEAVKYAGSGKVVGVK